LLVVLSFVLAYWLINYVPGADQLGVWKRSVAALAGALALVGVLHKLLARRLFLDSERGTITPTGRWAMRRFGLTEDALPRAIKFPWAVELLAGLSAFLVTTLSSI
jgi:hypothetical protein